MELGVGEALISFLDAKGSPTIVERAYVAPPACRLGPLTPAERSALIEQSLVYGHYEKTEDRESAYEKLRGNTVTAAPSTTATPQSAKPEKDGGFFGGALGQILFGTTGPRGGQHDGVVQTAAKSMARTMANEVGRQILRGVLGSIMGGRKR